GGKVAVEFCQTADGNHPPCLTVEWSPMLMWPRTPSTTSASPINEPSSVEFVTAAPAPTMVFLSSDRSILLPVLIHTFGPIVDADNVTPSSMYTGSTSRTPEGTDAGFRARPFSSMVRFVS